MKVKYKDSLKYKLSKFIAAISSNVVLRADITDLGGYRQVSRALKALLKEKQLIKIGFGIYAKGYSSKYSEKPLIKGGVDTALREALNRLNIAWEPGSAEKTYNTKKTTQVPVYNIVKLKNRCRRKIGYGKNKLIFERGINAR